MSKILTAVEWIVNNKGVEASEVVCYESKTGEGESMYVDELMEQYAKYYATQLIEGLSDEEIKRMGNDCGLMTEEVDPFILGAKKAHQHYLNKIK